MTHGQTLTGPVAGFGCASLRYLRGAESGRWMTPWRPSWRRAGCPGSPERAARGGLVDNSGKTTPGGVVRSYRGRRS